MSSERGRITEVLDDVLARAHFGEDVVPLEVTDSQADAVIQYLYQRADDPEVVEAVAKAMYDSAPTMGDEWVRLTNYQQGHWRERGMSAIAATLTALLGPRPSGEESEK